jgi:predicted nucleotide-binding protein (sugar kinase/HSP70/actin superfamily)
LDALEQSMIARARPLPQTGKTRRDREQPLIGIVGEIFCRLNTFSNENLIGSLETIRRRSLALRYRRMGLVHQLRGVPQAQAREPACGPWKRLGSWVRQRVQKRDEDRLVAVFKDDFAGREEPDIYEVLECARPYLPREGAFGEMVLNVGKAVYLAKKGAAGIIDISPFTCMNGIVCEAIYPQLSRDLGGIPIRNFYFDGTQSDLDRDLGVYMELARSYRKRRG